MRLLVPFFCLVQFSLVAQCTQCFSLEEALIEPERVESLTLRGQGYLQIPKEIEDFPHLKKLDLSVNLLIELDPSLLELPELEELIITQNPGMYVFEMKGLANSLPALKSLDLSQNGIRFISPALGELSSLERLNLASNQIDFLPGEFDKMANLKSVDVSNNQLIDCMWLRYLWNLEELHIQGNDKLDLKNVGLSLAEKDHLSSLELTPQGPNAVPSNFSMLPLRELILTDGTVENFNSRLSRCKSLSSIVLRNVDLSKELSFYASMNRCSNIVSLSCEDMRIPAKLYELTEIEEVNFDNCIFANVTDLRKIKPQIDIYAENCDIHSDNFLGNAKIARTVSIQQSETTEAMTNNSLESFVKPEVRQTTVAGDQASVINFGFSKFEVPAGAFLNQEGENYSGPVKVEVIEYDNPVISALDGVPMTYRSPNSNELFASAGMIDFRAYDDQGMELQPNPDQLIQVTLQDVRPDANTRLYSFNAADSNWQDIGLPKSSNYDSLRLALLDSLNLIPDSVIAFYRVVPARFNMNYYHKRNQPEEISFHSYHKGKFDRNYYKSPTPIVYTNNNDARWLSKGKIWRVDTLVTTEYNDLLQRISVSHRKHEAFWKRSGGGQGSLAHMPALIRNLQITPNLEDDNYTLTLDFKDEKIRIPVFESWESNAKKVQQREKRNIKTYTTLRNKEEKVVEFIRNHEKIHQENLAAAMRTNMVNNMIAMEQNAAVQKENLRFGMSAFGLVNCDYFSRETPDNFYAMAKNVKDQNGETVTIPSSLRCIFLNDNAFIEVPSDRVPSYVDKEVRLVFRIGENELGVVHGASEDDLSKMVVNRLNILELSPTQIYSKIIYL